MTRNRNRNPLKMSAFFSGQFFKIANNPADDNRDNHNYCNFFVKQVSPFFFLFHGHGFRP